MKIFLTIFLSLILFSSSFSQSVVDDFNDNDEVTSEAPDLVTEKIERIARSGRIFIISNENNSFEKGDFISLLINNKLATRAVVAKNINSQAGIKIVKIYSLRLYKTLARGLDVQVIRGDDSYFKISKVKPKDDTNLSKILDEDDLYNNTLLEDDLVLKDNSKRSIKTDNIIGFAIGQIQSINNDGSAQAYQHFFGTWAYQLDDNIFVEGLLGYSLLADFPSAGLNTTLYNFSVKAKYNVPLPFYSFIQPYVGFQMITATSNLDEENAASEEEIANDTARLDEVRGMPLVFGVTLLKRLVPGWFLRADLGSDLVGVGLSLEF